MDSTVRATRLAIAQQRLIAAAEAMGAQHERYVPFADSIKAVNVKDPATRALLQMEGAVALMETMAGITPPSVAPLDTQDAPAQSALAANVPSENAETTADKKQKKAEASKTTETKATKPAARKG